MTGYSYISLKSQARAYLAYFLFVCAKATPKRFHAPTAGKTRVLVFHHIDKPDRFRSILKILKAHYNLISYSDYVNGHKASDRLNIVIALDDGYRSWFTAGLPIFLELGIRPLLFINSDFVGLNEDAAKKYCRDCILTWPEASLSWDQVKALVAAGAEVGGHSHRHTNLTKAEPSAVAAVVRSDRLAIAAQLGCTPRLFAYPFGLYNSAVQNTLKHSGYEFAFTSDSSYLEKEDDPFLLKRTNVGLRRPLLVQAIAEGWADRITAFMASIRRIRLS